MIAMFSGLLALWRTRHCSHAHKRGVYGDEINAVSGRRLQCTDCWRYLDGDLSEANRPPRRQWVFDEAKANGFVQTQPGALRVKTADIEDVDSTRWLAAPSRCPNAGSLCNCTGDCR